MLGHHAGGGRLTRYRPRAVTRVRDGRPGWRYTRGIVEHPVITIEDPSRLPGGRGSNWLHGRRLAIAAGLAFAEVVAYLIIDPARWFGILLVGAVLAGCIAMSGRMKPGLGRELVLVAGLAQAMVIALPVLVGFVTLVVATLLVLLLIAVFVVVGLRFRR